jgi:hypothetical protein
MPYPSRPHTRHVPFFIETSIDVVGDYEINTPYIQETYAGKQKVNVLKGALDNKLADLY